MHPDGEGSDIVSQGVVRQAVGASDARTSVASADDNKLTRDSGSILVLVLVTSVVATLFILPILYYISTVARASAVTSNKAEAVELADGGTWVALNNQAALFDMCGVQPIPSSLDGVSVTCQVLDFESQRDPADVPYDAATVQADRPLAPGVGSDQYANPNTAADPSAWLTAADSTSAATAGKVWLPELPVRPVGTGDKRDQMLIPGTEDPLYSGRPCRVFFQGTFTEPITIDQPAYFLSGVYYFTQPITLLAGADVVAGPGEQLGCTNDATAPSDVENGQPIPLGTSGSGVTFVFGDEARLVIDDDGSDDIRFAMNPRYVSDEETSVAASADVSIISVNGDHGLTGTPGNDLDVPGVIVVPASTVGVDGSPRAIDQAYVPSVLTPKPGAPATPTVTSTVSYQRDRSGNGGPNDRGRVTVFWDAPADNGSAITGYTVTDETSGRSCSPAVVPGYAIQTSCTIDGITNQSAASGLTPSVWVTATNAAGTSGAVLEADWVDGDRLDLGGNDQVDGANTPDAPGSTTAVAHPDGMLVSWDVPDDGGSPITGYRVTVTANIDATTSTCNAQWNETSCVVPYPAAIDVPTLFGAPDLAAALTDPTNGLVLDVVALQSEGSPATEFVGAPAFVDAGDVTLDTDPAPDLTPAPLPDGEREAILDFSVEHSANVDITIAGYVSVPAGRVELSSASPSTSSVTMSLGLLAGAVDIDPAGAPTLNVYFDNPIGQKRILIESTASGAFEATSRAVVQVNASGSIAINSWSVQ